MDRVKDICRIGQKADCCKYLMGSVKGFQCAKDPELEGFKDLIDGRDDMVAKGDNCDGWEGTID